MNKGASIFFAVIAVLIVVTSANPETRPRRQSCNDGRLCTCRRYLNEIAYKAASKTVKCLDSFGYRHDFTNGARSVITHQMCVSYVGDVIKRAEIRKCVFRGSFIFNVNGKDFWDIQLVRDSLIFFFTFQFLGPELAPVRNFITKTFHSCDPDPTNFDVFPFDECWKRALPQVQAMVEDARNNYKNLSDDGKDLIRIDKVDTLTLMSLKSASEDLAISADLDISELLE